MQDYELLIIISPEVEKDKETAAVKEIVAEVGGEITKTEDWGRKELSYPIKNQRVGNYLLYYLKLNVERVSELKQELRIREGLLRFMLTQSEVKV